MEVLKDRIALIAGAGDEIGQAIGMRFGTGGATVVACGPDANRLEDLVVQIKAAGGKAVAKLMDPTDSEQVKRVVNDVAEQYGRIDILVTNTDSQCTKAVCDVTDADWATSIRCNLSPAFYFCRETMPKMKQQKYGRIVNISSLDYIGWPGKAGYSAVKSAVFGLTRSLALESAKDEVTVNCVAKGDVATSQMPAEVAEKIGGALPVKRIGSPEDIARAVGFFASDTSKYITGQTFFVCGGKSAHFSMSI